jgi:hypothetical protein
MALTEAVDVESGLAEVRPKIQVHFEKLICLACFISFLLIFWKHMEHGTIVRHTKFGCLEGYGTQCYLVRRKFQKSEKIIQNHSKKTSVSNLTP